MNISEMTEAICAQRLAYRAAVFAEMSVPQNAGADALSATSIRMLEAALQIAREKVDAKDKAKRGRPDLNWEKLTGKTLDRLIYDARLDQAVLQLSVRKICELIVRPLIQRRQADLDAAKVEDNVRKAILGLADHMKPSKLWARYRGATLDGIWRINSPAT